MKSFGMWMLVSVLLLACSDSGTSGGGGAGGGNGEGGTGGILTFTCEVGEECIVLGDTCYFEPGNTNSGSLLCQEGVFISTCQENFFCSNDGSTPDYFPRCLSPAGDILECNLERHALELPENGGGGAGGGMTEGGSRGAGGSP